MKPVPFVVVAVLVECVVAFAVAFVEALVPYVDESVASFEAVLSLDQVRGND